jgi:hypothetical protein
MSAWKDILMAGVLLLYFCGLLDCPAGRRRRHTLTGETGDAETLPLMSLELVTTEYSNLTQFSELSLFERVWLLYYHCQWFVARYDVVASGARYRRLASMWLASYKFGNGRVA